MDEKGYWIGINLIKGIGAVRFRALLDYFGDAKTAWQARPSALREAGLSAKLIERFTQARRSVDLEALWQKIAAQHIRVMTWNDADYPARLREITQPPPVLYLRGALTHDDNWSVAIVGTRRVSAYGRQVTEEIASFLARNGVTVVSGLARGVDGIAHQAALNAGGRTLAVLGSGVDRIYPPEHRLLAEQIETAGAIISDYPPGTPPESSNFPPRNRIISGLSMGTLVIEAGETSGALITARFALDQGREVFALPGNIFAPQSKGPNKLIQQGAHPVLMPQDVLDVLDMTRFSEQRQARELLPADEIEAKLLSLLGYEPLHVDELRNQAGLPVEKVSSTLVMMELKGMVRHVGGMQYVVAREAQADYEA